MHANILGTLLAVSGALVALDYVPGAEASKAYATCMHDRWRYSEVGFLFGICRTKDGNYMNSVLDTNRCFANSRGSLVRRDDGFYTRSCKSCERENNSIWLNCLCQDPKGDWKRSRLDMNDHLTNIDGHFCCRMGFGFCSTGFVIAGAVGRNATLVGGTDEGGLEFTGDGGLAEEVPYDDPEGSLDLDEIPFEEVGLDRPPVNF